MRLEYRIELDKIEVPRFSVEAVEGIGKVFTLAALVLNVLESKRSVDLVFHGLNPDDPERNDPRCWDAFEEEFPGTFANTFQLWCQRPE